MLIVNTESQNPARDRTRDSKFGSVRNSKIKYVNDKSVLNSINNEYQVSIAGTASE